MAAPSVEEAEPSGLALQGPSVALQDVEEPRGLLAEAAGRSGLPVLQEPLGRLQEA